MKQSNLIIIFVIIIILVGGGAFYGGMKYSQTKALNFGPGNFQRNGSGANARRISNANFINGDTIAKDDKSVTVKLRDGGSKIIFYSSTTEIAKMASGTLSDINVGTSVMATGKANADGSISAQTIQIRPAGMPGGFGGPGANNLNAGIPGQVPDGAPRQ